MKISVIICSMGRPDSLQQCLHSLNAEDLAKNGEAILVYSGNDRATADVMSGFAGRASFPVTVVRGKHPGLSAARNTGIAAAKGEIIAFIDDDCRMHDDHIKNLLAEMQDKTYAYGGGRIIHIYGDHEHVNDRSGLERSVVPPRTFLPTGAIQGTNMFFRRELFGKLGGFREDLGPGVGILGAEDGEMVARVSLAGYTGVLLPNVIVDHHQPKPWSDELNKKHESYEIGRGIYYANLLLHGVQEAWDLWRQDSQRLGNPPSRRDLERLQREFFGAAEYIKHSLNAKKND